MSHTTKDESAIERLMASSVLCACSKCGSTATYRGSSDAINKAAKEFYELHERCWTRRKIQTNPATTLNEARKER